MTVHITKNGAEIRDEYSRPVAIDVKIILHIAGDYTCEYTGKQLHTRLVYGDNYK